MAAIIHTCWLCGLCAMTNQSENLKKANKWNNLDNQMRGPKQTYAFIHMI